MPHSPPNPNPDRPSPPQKTKMFRSRAYVRCDSTGPWQVVTIAAPNADGSGRSGGKGNTEGGGDDNSNSNDEKSGSVGSHDQRRAGERGAGGGASRKKRERKVRLMHVSRPLMGGLRWAPENAGELDMATVDKYTAVLRSYPGEMDGLQGKWVEQKSSKYRCRPKVVPG